MTVPLDARALLVIPAGPLTLTVRAPSSKSLTNRALLVAALADGTSRLGSPLDSEDARAMVGAVEALGARVSREQEELVVHGTAGRLRAPLHGIQARLSGTTMRFVAAVAALAPGEVRITGEAALLRRPIGPLTTALRQLGAHAMDAQGHPPVTVGGGLAGGHVSIDVRGSSQFASAILLAAPYARSDVVVAAEGTAADAYIEMTVDLMRRWGAVVEDEGSRTWRVLAGRTYQARDEAIEYDASAAAHLYALAVATGGSVTVTSTVPGTVQPDAGILDVLLAMGATAAESDGALTVRGPSSILPVNVDLSAMPDQVTTVAALAALADGRSVITGVGVTRGHETDRLAALARELRKIAVDVEEEPDGLVIQGGHASGPATLSTYHDHRLAMAFAALAARIPTITIEDPGCVAKTYPAFWDDAQAAGLGIAPLG